VLGNSGTGSIWHVNALLLERSAGLSLVHLPFSGSGATLTSLMGQHVDAAVAGAGEASPHVASGRLRVISVFGSSGSRLFPGVAASAEEGFDFGADAWSGFFAPRGIPAAAREALTAAMREAFHHETFQRLCEERGMEPVFLASDAFRAFAESEASRFAVEIPRLLRMKR
jgi:tripartite-type tricarboxylate transporter receptor subunit TctC